MTFPLPPKATGSGSGDMLKSVYDTDNNATVDNSEKLGTYTLAQVQNHVPQAHTLASHSTKAHSELTGIGADDHHPQAHTLASHSTKAHSELTGVGADDHHAQAHKNAHKTGGADALLVTDLLDSVARLDILHAGTDIGKRRKLNLIEGLGISLNVVDDPANEKVDATITGGGGGGTYKLSTSYRIYKVSSTWYAMDADGTIGFSGSVFETVWNNVGNALNALGGGELLLLRGTHQATGIIYFYSNVSYFGENGARINLWGSGTAFQSVATNYENRNWSDPVGTQDHDITVYNIQFYGAGVSQNASVKLITFRHATRVNFLYCHVTYALNSNWGLTFDGNGSGNSTTDNLIFGCTGTQIYFDIFSVSYSGSHDNIFAYCKTWGQTGIGSDSNGYSTWVCYRNHFINCWSRDAVYGFVLQGSPDISMQKCFITGCAIAIGSTAINEGGWQYGHRTQITDCEIWDNTYTGANYQFMLDSGDEWVIKGCTIRASTSYYGQHDLGIYSGNSHRVSNCTFIGYWTYAIEVNGGSNHTITDCLFDGDNTGSAPAIYVTSGRDAVHIEGNTFTSSYEGVTIVSGATNTKIYFNRFLNSATVSDAGTNTKFFKNEGFLTENLLTNVTVGTGSTTIAHGLAVTPNSIRLIPRADARVWRSADPNGTNIYLQANVSVSCDIYVSKE